MALPVTASVNTSPQEETPALRLTQASFVPVLTGHQPKRLCKLWYCSSVELPLSAMAQANLRHVMLMREASRRRQDWVSKYMKFLEETNLWEADWEPSGLAREDG